MREGGGSISSMIVISNCKKTFLSEKWGIPPELVLNWDQTGIKLVPCSSWTMDQSGVKIVEIVGANNKRQITARISYLSN